MPQNDTPASDDAVGVAVVNYKMPRLRTRAEVLANANKIRQMIEGLKLGLPGLDLVIFPAYSTHGLLQGDGHDDDAMLNTVGSIPGDETAVLARACRNAQVWGVFSLGCPAEHTLVLMDDQGDIVQAHRGTDCDMPSVCAGPKGMTVSLSDGHSASAAELIVGCPVESTALPAPQALALAHHSYVAVANAAGFDGVRCHFGRSAVIGFDGHTLGECGEEDYGIQFVQLSKRLIREARGQAVPPQGITSASCGPRSHPASRAPAEAPHHPRP